jgi:hypothetical protein
LWYILIIQGEDGQPIREPRPAEQHHDTVTRVRNPTAAQRTWNYRRRRRHGDLTSHKHVIHALERARRMDTTGSVSPVTGLIVALGELGVAIWITRTFAGDDLHPLIVAAASLGVIVVMASGMLAPETLIVLRRQRQYHEDPVGRLLVLIGGPAALPAGWLNQIDDGLTSWRPGFARIERWIHRELPGTDERETFTALADEFEGTLAELVLTTKMLVGQPAGR